MSNDQHQKPTAQTEFKSLSDFYPYYLSEHQNRTSRRLHLIGSTLGLSLLVYAITTAQHGFIIAAPIAGYGFAWSGHFFFEHNKPATFKHPLYSFCSDWIMYKDILTGKIPF